MNSLSPAAPATANPGRVILRSTGLLLAAMTLTVVALVALSAVVDTWA